MVKVRQDAWSHEDDLLLAETVLRHIREGSTQLMAFEEVGDQLNRTAAACGFRWNAEVRKNYEKAVDLAKRQRKQRKKAMKENPVETKETVEHVSIVNQSENTEKPTSIDDIIQQLEQLRDSATNLQNEKAVEMQENLDQLMEENEKLKEKYAHLEKEYETLKEDYQTFVNIMDRARKMVVLDEDSSLSSPAFKMSKNGNLEQIAK